MFNAAELTERVEESKRLLLGSYPWASVIGSRIFWENGEFVTQVELTHPDLKGSVGWDSRKSELVAVHREDHETWKILTEGKFMRNT